MATLKFAPLAGAQIDDEQIVGSFADFAKDSKLKVGLSHNRDGQPIGFWANLQNEEGTVLINASKRINRTLFDELKGIEDKNERIAIVQKAFLDSTIVEIDATLPPEPGQAVGAVKKNPDGSNMKRYIATSRTEDGMDVAAVTASVAKASTFSLKAAMSNRV